MMTELKTTDVNHYSNIYSPRVRHLKSIYIRNISYKPQDVNHLKVFFTLHRAPNSTGTLNPWWQSFDLTFLPCYYSSTNQITIRVWVKDQDSTAKTHLEYTIDLRRLIPSSDQFDIHSDPNKLAATDVISFSMFDYTYALPGPDITAELGPTLMVPNGSILKPSYSCNLLRRLQVVLRALKQTEQSVERVRDDIQIRLSEIKHVAFKKQEMESLRVKITELKEVCERMQLLKSEKKSCLDGRRSVTNKLEKEMNACEILMRDDDNHHGQLKSDYYSSREKLLKANTLLAKRHKQMVHELIVIYPIEEMEEGKYMIAGVHLPNFDALFSQSEITTATALGHCCHLVSVLSKFLGIPLQFPIEYRGSRSLIYDVIQQNNIISQQKDQSFPLYSRGKDKQSFKYAVFLLNKNIGNLRHAYSLTTKDLRFTLKNLRDFVYTKFDVGMSQASVIQRLSTPSSMYRTQSTPSLTVPPGVKELRRNGSLFTAPTIPSTEEESSDEAVNPYLNGIVERKNITSKQLGGVKRDSTVTLMSSHSDCDVTASTETTTEMNGIAQPTNEKTTSTVLEVDLNPDISSNEIPI